MLSIDYDEAKMTTRTRLGEEVTQLILETFRFNGALLAAGNQITKEFGLTSARWQVLGAIEIAEEPITVSQISKKMGLSRQAVQRIVNELVKHEFVCLVVNPSHKRAPLVSLSSKGEHVMKSINNAQAIWVNELSEGLNKERVIQSLSVLQLLRERIEQSDH